MTIDPILLKGNLSLGATDVSGEVTTFKISAAVDAVDVPATLAGPKSSRAGGVSYQIEVGGFMVDGTEGVLFGKLWTALGTASKELAFSGNLQDGSPGAGNPTVSGTLIVTEASVGGEAEGHSEGSFTFPLKDAPSWSAGP